jgi:hypothetical protein
MFIVCVNDDFGISGGTEYATFLPEFPAKFYIIENFAVKNKMNITIPAGHGLVTGITQVNNGEAIKTKVGIFILEIPLVIRAAMTDGFQDSRQLNLRSL